MGEHQSTTRIAIRPPGSRGVYTLSPGTRSLAPPFDLAPDATTVAVEDLHEGAVRMIYRRTGADPGEMVLTPRALSEALPGSRVFAELPWPGGLPPRGLRVWELVEVLVLPGR